MHGLLISALLLATPTVADAATQAAAVAGPRPIARVWLRGEGLDMGDLAAAVQARLADKEVLGPGASAGAIDGLAALCLIRWDTGTVRLEVILGDGRVYERSITAKGAGRERTAARLIASTLASIEDETATPDRHDGVLDTPDVERPPQATEVAPEPEPSTVPAPPTAPPVQVREQPVAAPVEPSPRTTAPAPPVKNIELGVVIDPGAALGLRAPGRGLAGAGGGLRVDLRLRRGVVLGAAFRGLAQARDTLVLGRFRGALLAGYGVRRGAFELVALAGPTLETWQVTQRGAPVAYEASGPGGASLLLGALARLVVGARVAQGKRVALRVGGYVELTGSARASGRAAQVARLDATGAPVTVFVLGGAELSLGVELALSVALRRR